MRRLRLPRDWRLLTPLVSILAVASALYAAWDQGWSFDERIHIAWSQRLLTQRVDERASLGRFESKTPIVVPNVLLMSAARAAGIADEARVRFAGRLPTVFCLAALLLATFHLARRCFGDTAAHLATIATALDPNLAANGSLISVDVAYALAVVLTAWAALAFVREPSLRAGLALGLGLGLAFAAKFSAVLLLPALALLPLVEPRPAGPPGILRRAAAGVGLAAVTAAALLCAAYLFIGVGARLDTLSFLSRPFAAVAQLMPGLRLPLPRAFLTGLDRTLVRERQVWSVYILGAFRPNGVWYYFPVLWALKTPLLVLVAEIVGFVQLVREGILLRSGAARFLAITLVLNLVYFVFFFHTQIGYRFVLMCVPLGYTLAAAGLASLPAATAVRLAGAVVVAVALGENLMYWGNPLAFTNAAVWPKRSVWRLMCGSDVDYGQDRERIRRWLVEAQAAYTKLDPVHILPGHNTVSLNALVGLAEEPERYRWLRANVPPSGQIGYTHFWWIVDDGTYDHFMTEERRLVPGPEASALCPGDLQPYPAGARIPLSLDEPPGRTRAFVVCLSVRKQTDMALKADAGVIRFGPYGPGPTCASAKIAERQESWYRLEPGLHAFCVEEIPNRRARFPYRFEGAWRFRGHGALFGLHERP